MFQKNSSGFIARKYILKHITFLAACAVQTKNAFLNPEGQHQFLRKDLQMSSIM
jgi:hypothetical protein